MKPLLLSAAAALALGGPALADSPLDFALEHFAQSHESGDGPRTVPAAGGDGIVISTSNADGIARARAHFAQAHETGDGARYHAGDALNVVVSTANADLVAFAAAKLDNDLRGDN